MATAASATALRRLSLSAYNWVVFFGWAQVMCYAASALLESGHEAVYAAVERPLQFAQTAAFMEPFTLYILNIGQSGQVQWYMATALVCLVHGNCPSVLFSDMTTAVKQIWKRVRTMATARRMVTVTRCVRDHERPHWSPSSKRDFRFVRSPISTTLPQITGRLYITWGILWSFHEAQSHILLTSLIISWSITEVIRYFFFGMKETFGVAPYWLLWLRYSTFLVFYPTGIVSEVGLILVAMPFMKTSRKYFMMPNKWNFSFNYHYELTLVTALIIPGFPYLFRYMVAKRKKVLSAAKTA
ncbi:hypothetical protein TRIUR3_25650 [Triticum urartu]|uniref:Very-long-chain (3R)-3-hydroxyacyl-CoA dehydratase n=1 Tax=Triticum urartu TaxID=4572 RepID=M8AGR3_TRIUA|nr:hypothetical protein TRIUR3_25650 [Triticum urartu]